MRFETYVVMKIWIIAFWHTISCRVVQIFAEGGRWHLQGIDVHPPNTRCCTVTHKVTSIPLTTNQSYNQNFLKKLSIQTIIIM
jgi:hypothetical protein